MAPKSSSKPKGEGKQGLVVTLVFFILATIGLGISTYTGYNADDGKEKKLKDKDNELKTIKEDRDWYKFQSMLFLAYMGLLKGEDQNDLAIKKDQFDQNTLGQNQKDREALQTLIKQNFEKFEWDKDQKKFKKSYEGLLVDERNKYDALEKQVTLLTKEKNDALQAQKTAEDVAKAAKDKYKDDLDKLTKKLATDNADLVKKKDELLADLTRVSKEKEAFEQKLAGEHKLLLVAAEKQKKDTKDLRGQLEAKDAVINQIQQKGQDAPKDWRTDWRIVSIDRLGDTVYINLGSADKVTPQLTFSVHGLGTDQKPLPVPKGTMEVISVVGPHLSQARITNVKDKFRDPILKGDILFNPLWNPTLKKHVALTGLIDLTGDGRGNPAEYTRNLDEFMRKLEGQNVLVDAWLDPKSMKVKGKGISVQTDYLIIGDGQEYLPERAGAALREGVTRGLKQMQDDAKRNGVQTIGMRKYLEMIGYRLPHSVNDRSPSSRRSADLAPGPKNPPMR